MKELGLQQDTWLHTAQPLRHLSKPHQQRLSFCVFLIALIYIRKPAGQEASERATGVICHLADGWREGITTSLAPQKKPRDPPGGEMRWKRTLQLEKVTEQEGMEGPDSS